MLRDAARPRCWTSSRTTLEDIARRCATRDHGARDAALVRARGIDELGARFEEAVDVSRETTRYAPPRRRAAGAVEFYADAAARIDLAVRNVRVLARGTIRALSLDENVPPEIARRAARPRRRRARAGARARDPASGSDAVREPALRAAASATQVLEGTTQPVGERDRRPDPLDRHRPAHRHRDELRGVDGRGARRRPRGRGRALTELGWEQVRAWRLARHGLAERAPAGELLAVTSRLCGVHAQLMGSAELTLWARLEACRAMRSARAVGGADAGEDLGDARDAAPAPRGRDRALAGRARHLPPLPQARVDPRLRASPRRSCWR